jgi:Flp pilus assembly protein TadD
MRATLNAHPNDAAAELLYLRLLVLQDDDLDAQPIAQKMLAEHPQDFDALYLSGVVENDEQQYALAVEHLKAAARLRPNHYDVRFNLGTAYARLKQNEAARDELAKAVALDPSKAEAHFHLAQVLRSLGQTTDVQTQLKLF